MLATRWRNRNPGALLVGMENDAAAVGDGVASPKETEQNHRVIQELRVWVHAQKDRRQGLPEMLVYSCSQQRYSQSPKDGSIPK